MQTQDSLLSNGNKENQMLSSVPSSSCLKQRAKAGKPNVSQRVFTHQRTIKLKGTDAPGKKRLEMISTLH